MEKRIKEIEDLFKFNQPFCAMDAIEEVFPDLNLEDTKDKDFFKLMLEYALPSKVALEFIDYLKSKNFDFSMNWIDEGSIANIYVKKVVSTTLAEGNAEVFNTLIDLGVDVSAVDKKGNNILHALANEKIGTMTRELQEIEFAKTIINTSNIEELMVENYDGNTPLSIIINTDINVQKEKNIGLITHIFGLMNEVGMSIEDSDKFKLVAEACSVADIGLLKMLLKMGVDETHKSDNGFSIAHYLTAHISRDTRMVNDIMEKKIEMLKLIKEVDLTDDQGRTPLIYGMANTSATTPAFWDVLIKKGVNVNATDNNSNCAIIYSVINLEAVEALVNVEGINLNARNQKGQTALIKALLDNKIDAALVLIKAGIDTSITDNDGNDALTIATSKGQMKIVEAIMGA